MNSYFDFTLYLIAGLVGILGHWWNRWAQDRTTNTFFQYLTDNKKYTVGAVISIFSATTILYTSINPPDLSMELLLLSYLSGYKLDSVVNRDSTTPIIIKNDSNSNAQKATKNDKVLDIINKSRNN